MANGTTRSCRHEAKLSHFICARSLSRIPPIVNKENIALCLGRPLYPSKRTRLRDISWRDKTAIFSESHLGAGLPVFQSIVPHFGRKSARRRRCGSSIPDPLGRTTCEVKRVHSPVNDVAYIIAEITAELSAPSWGRVKRAYRSLCIAPRSVVQPRFWTPSGFRICGTHSGDMVRIG